MSVTILLSRKDRSIATKSLTVLVKKNQNNSNITLHKNKFKVKLILKCKKITWGKILKNN